MIRALRAFFDDRGFVEVDTPVALTAMAPESHIEAPSVVLHLEKGSYRRYLQTSPELPMKRLLAAGLPQIYQIAPVFRDGDLSPQHRPEFRLLEWYRRDQDWTILLDDCQDLVRSCATAIEADCLRVGDRRISIGSEFARLSVDAAFCQYAGFSILDALDLETLQGCASRAGVHFEPSDDWNDLFHRVFLNLVEPSLAAFAKPLFLTDYPAPLASLARLNPRDPRTAERFELFVGGIELANGFGELTDAAEQRRRFAVESIRRAEAGQANYPDDERFFAALEQLPTAVGIALGVERLLMLLFGANDIDAISLLPWEET